MQVIFNGQILSQAHLDLLVPLLNEGMSEKKLRKCMGEVFEAAGIPVPQLKIGDLVHWQGLEERMDKGVILGIESRGDKLRVQSKQRGRAVTIGQRDARVVADA